MISTQTQSETAQHITGPAGRLELRVAKQKSDERNTWGIVCHPHSLFGGTMNNKVVMTLVKTFQGLGLNTVRFNFRGVGQSQGEFDHGRGELEDLLAVVDWVRREHGKHFLWLAGFSFGAYIAAQAAAQLPAQKLVTIAPPVQHFPLRSVPPILCDWVLVQGEKDEVVPADEVIAWAESRQPPPVIIRFPEAGHFFHGQLVELRRALENALR